MLCLRKLAQYPNGETQVCLTADAAPCQDTERLRAVAQMKFWCLDVILQSVTKRCVCAAATTALFFAARSLTARRYEAIAVSVCSRL
jgi:hypothetical protein